MPPAKKTKKQLLKFVIDCSVPVADNVIDPASFEKYLQDRIKVDGKTGVLGDRVKLFRDGDKLHVHAKEPFSKRYLKYLTKKYLKKQQLRDFLHVIAPNPSSYQLRYFNIHADDEE